MSIRRFSIFGFIILIALAGVFGEASSSPSSLGKIEFQTSGSSEAQKRFLHGVAALHSFWYKEALEAFRESTKIDSGFAMGYWGEAMARNHPLWEEQDTQAAKEALAKIPEMAKTTVREKAYLNAVRLLYGDGDKQSRDEAYSIAMGKISRDYPEDIEASCFYALSLLGAARGSGHKFQMNVQAGSVGLDIFRKKPGHPCAAHYTIHAFDHPDLAILALPAARRYAQIAPASHHAQHMPAHIFLQLGMWPEAAAANEAGWKNSVAWVEREGLPVGKRSYHSLQWLHYVYLQQGRWNEANEILRLKVKDMNEAPGDSQTLSASRRRVDKYYYRMLGASVFERERWESAAAIKDPSGVKPTGYPLALLSFIRAYAAAALGRVDVDRRLAELNAVRSQGIAGNYFNKSGRLDIWALDVKAAVRASEKDYDAAVALMEKAVVIEERLPAPSGPPRIVKPTYELYGEILLLAGKPERAMRQFALSLLRHPNRARSLLGAARAAANIGDRKEAAERYSKFLAIWSQADPALPELLEAKDYLLRPDNK